MRVIKITEQKQLRPLMTSAWETVKAAFAGGPVEVVIRRPSKSRDQEEKYHAMIGDIAATVDFDDGKKAPEVWKAWLLVEFERELHANGERLRRPSQTIIGRDGVTPITVRASSKEFSVSEASQFIEFLYSKSVEYGATLSDKSLAYYEEIANG